MTLPNNHPYLRLASRLLPLSFAAAIANAQDNGGSAPVETGAAAPPVAVVHIEGNAEQYDPRRDDTAARIVVSHDEIVKYGDTSLADVLKRQPGVTVNGGNAGRGGEIRMRGLGAGYTQILLNGEPAPPGFTLDSLTPEQVERIEIVRAAMAEYSAQGIAGTINIQLKSKVRKAQRELSLNVEGSNTFRTSMANLQVSDKVEDFSYSISANIRAGVFNPQFYETDEAYDAAGKQTVLRRARFHEDGRVDFATLVPRLNWSLPNGDKLTSESFLTLTRIDYEGGGKMITEYGELPRYSTQSRDVTNDTIVARTDLTWLHQRASGAKVETRLGAYKSMRDNRNDDRGLDVSDELTLARRTVADIDGSGLTFSSKYRTALGKGHLLVAGINAGTDRTGETHEQREGVPVYGPAVLEHYDAKMNRLALFAQDEWEVTPKFSIYLGLRTETLKLTSEGDAFRAINSRYTVVSPVLQTLWKLPNSDKDQVRFALTRTFRAPPVGRLTPRREYSLNNNSNTPDTIGNPSLKPELATGIDLAYEHYFSDRALVSAAFSMRRISDFTYDNIMLSGDRWLSMPINDGNAHTRSVELEAKFPVRQWYTEAPAIDFRANIARNWSSVDNVPGPNNRVAAQTPLSGSVGLDYTASPKFNAGGSFTLRTGGPLRITPNRSSFNTVKRELEFYGLWKFDATTQLRVSAVNLLAQPTLIYTQYSDADGTQRDLVETPSRVLLRLTLETKF